MRVAPRRLCAPEPLAAKHEVSRFSNGLHSSLDQWLRERARSSEGLSARTYVVCSIDEPDRVLGYFSISAAMEQRNALPSAKLRRGMPEQVPLLLIGRLAIDAEWRGRGLRSALFGRCTETVCRGVRDRRGTWCRCPRHRRNRPCFLRAPRFHSFTARRAHHADADETVRFLVS